MTPGICRDSPSEGETCSRGREWMRWPTTCGAGRTLSLGWAGAGWTGGDGEWRGRLEWIRDVYMLSRRQWGAEEGGERAGCPGVAASTAGGSWDHLHGGMSLSLWGSPHHASSEGRMQGRGWVRERWLQSSVGTQPWSLSWPWKFHPPIFYGLGLKCTSCCLGLENNGLMSDRFRCVARFHIVLHMGQATNILWASVSPAGYFPPNKVAGMSPCSPWGVQSTPPSTEEVLCRWRPLPHPLGPRPLLSPPRPVHSPLRALLGP